MEYGCIGERLPHSFSKDIHERIGGYAYELCELAPDEVGAFMQKKDFRAINVTIPYKQTVIPYLDHIDEAAAAIGAVNTVVNKNGKLFGYNTDFYGLSALIGRAQISLKNKKVLVLGTGGTSKTACAVALRLGAKEVLTVSRKAAPGVVTYGQAAAEHKNTQVIINATPVGMYPQIDASPLDLSPFTALEAVFDAVYNPLITRLVLAARKRGITAQTGLYMLVAQAVRAYEIFMEKEAPAGCAERIYTELYNEKRNVVLIGMPGCGKTTVGRLLAEKTGKAFCDTDALITERAGMQITDIFARYGEAYFRDLEQSVIAETAKNTGCIIATGGGAVLRNKNTSLLSLNGTVVFLDRDPDLLLPTSDRPLALTAEAILQRYNERYGLYTAAADIIVKADASPEAAADETERRLGL